MTPEEISFTVGLVTGAIFVIVFMIASPVIQTAIDEANRPELGAPCQSWGVGGIMTPPSDDWYKEHCWVSMNSSIDHFQLHNKEECACYEYAHRGIITRFWEQVDKVI
jgi:hypothetical protein